METIPTTRRIINDARAALVWTGTGPARRYVDMLDSAITAAGISLDDGDNADVQDDHITIALPDGVRVGILRQTRVILYCPSDITRRHA